MTAKNNFKSEIHIRVESPDRDMSEYTTTDEHGLPSALSVDFGSSLVDKLCCFSLFQQIKKVGEKYKTPEGFQQVVRFDSVHEKFPTGHIFL